MPRHAGAPESDPSDKGEDRQPDRTLSTVSNHNGRRSPAETNPRRKSRKRCLRGFVLPATCQPPGRPCASAGSRRLVLGVPRGSIPVAAAVARELEAQRDVVVARKLGAPVSQELAIGAVSADGGRYLTEPMIRDLQVGQPYPDRVTTSQMAEVARREVRFRSGAAAPPVAGRTVILVDDGLALLGRRPGLPELRPDGRQRGRAVAPRSACGARDASGSLGLKATFSWRDAEPRLASRRQDRSGIGAPRCTHGPDCIPRHDRGRSRRLLTSLVQVA